jgi:hypothetical protein
VAASATSNSASKIGLPMFSVSSRASSAADSRRAAGDLQQHAARAGSRWRLGHARRSNAVRAAPDRGRGLGRGGARACASVAPVAGFTIACVGSAPFTNRPSM